MIAREPLYTSTGEPFQPIRLFYAVSATSNARQRLKRLRCIQNVSATELVWLHKREAKELRFAPHGVSPSAGPPTVLGRFRFVTPTELTLQLRSLPRARAAAAFFAKILGADVTLTRLRIVNRFFERNEIDKGLQVLEAELDQNVTSCREPTMNSATKQLNMTAAFDVPLIEDCPVHPDDDTPDYTFLGYALNLRMLRAHDHFVGGKRTLGQIEIDDVRSRMRKT